MAATVSDLSYQNDHKFWQMRVHKEIANRIK